MPLTFTGAVTLAGAVQAIGNYVPPPPPPPSVIGQSYGGGYYAGQISTTANSVATHYLIVAPAELSDVWQIQYKTSNSSDGTTSRIDGPGNSTAMNNASHPAAQYCKALNIGGYTDWYLPAIDELEICYYNLKPNAANSMVNGSVGTNAHSVPSRASTYYTEFVPGATTAAVYQWGGAQRFTVGDYWSSTELSQFVAAKLNFNEGVFGGLGKSSNCSIRAVRRVAV